MKINWGTGIVIAMVLFIGFIMYFVVQMLTSHEYDPEMVAVNYYHKEYVFQQEVDAIQNANALSKNIVVKKEEDSFVVFFPENFEVENITGTISMYRASDKNLDQEFPIQLNNHQYKISTSQLAKGKWLLSVDWNYKDTRYLYKKALYN